MNTPRHTGLGGGVGDLLQRTDPELTPHHDGPAAEEPVGAHFAEVPISDIRPNPRQPRTVFDEDALAELFASIT